MKLAFLTARFRIVLPPCDPGLCLSSFSFTSLYFVGSHARHWRKKDGNDCCSEGAQRPTVHFVGVLYCVLGGSILS